MNKSKILFVNDYPMDEALRLWKDGVYPGQHLWGMNKVEQLDRKVVYSHWIRESNLTPILKKIGLSPKRLFRFKLLWGKLKRRNIYFGSYWAYKTVGRAAISGILRHRIIVLVHHPIPYSKADGSLLQAAKGVFFLNSFAYQETLRNFPNIQSKSHVVGWCLDTGFYDRISADGEANTKLIVAAGKTMRDYDTFVAAIRLVNDPDLRVEIYCSSDTAPQVTDTRVKVFLGTENGTSINYTDLVKRYKQAFAIAVPMQAADKTIGLTSIWDAFAVAKPVLVTHNKGIDVPIAAERLGVVIQHGKVQAWADAITALLADPAAARQMGENGRRFAEKHLNERQYAQQLNKLFEQYFD